MPALDPERLRAIKTLPQLLAYLRNELDWPIETEDVEDLTFDYQPGELGLDAATAVKIKEIKQLRPLTGQQPWGIFWINFEKKRLPVVIMRRILRALVLKKRVAAHAAERKAWQPSDLLFISAYGEDTDRAITFAHFVENEAHSNLAELRVLGWDDDDTPLKYDYILHTLQDKLHWRADFAHDADFWRQTWRSAFTLRHREVITTSKELALALAGLAKRIRGRVRSILRYETGFGQIRTLQRAFQQGLIHDLTDDDFADMLAQTVTYGLFSVAVRRTFPGMGTAIVREDVPDLIITSPFLKDMLGIFLGIKTRKGKLDFDELGVADVEELLRSPDTHMEAVLRDFGNRTRQEDPVIHFYELFLNEYDKQRKIQRGVFYTPQPVVSYIVRSIHELLQTEFGLEDGLASTETWGEMLKRYPGLKLPPLTDEPEEKRTISPEESFVAILDPATGTGTFLVEVIEIIHKTMTGKWSKFGKTAADITKLWNDYVPKNLLPRLYGYELMMAPYAIAHMKIGLKLLETHYRVGTEDRARIYLTNSLEPKVTQLPHISFEALAHEAKEVNEVKWYKRFTVVIGNPPYSNFGQLNRIPFILGLLEDYKRGLNERKLNLDDDFIKFVRFTQWIIEQTGIGILGFITNNTYIDGITHRRMRESLLQLFSDTYVLDLHGSLVKGERSPDGSVDGNVFDIQQGVAIGLFIKKAKSSSPVVRFAELWGERDDKYATLLKTHTRLTNWTTLEPRNPYFFLVPKNLEGKEEYERYISLPTVMPAGTSAVQTKRDALFIDFDKASLRQRMKNVIEHGPTREMMQKYPLEASAGWSPQCLKGVTYSEASIRPYLYRPFDLRYIYYDNRLLGRSRIAVFHNLLSPNMALATLRQTVDDAFRHVFCSAGVCDINLTIGHHVSDQVFPLYIYPSEDLPGFSKRRYVNYSPAFITSMCSALGLKWVAEGQGDLKETTGPEDIFYYAYAVLHSPGYRTRYAEFLKIDFPRLPLTSRLDLFRALAKLGGELVALHLMESPKLDKHITKWVGGKNPEVEKVTYSHETVWTDKAQTEGFCGVPEPVWNFHIGGYQVCEKWLKDRKGRTLTAADLEHYHRIVVALSETIRLMAEIDQLIETHGGWPGAFQTSAPVTEVH